MPLPSVTYEQYKAQGGTLEADAFAASLRAAVSAVRDVIGYNEPQDDDDVEAYTRAVCAAVDVDEAYGASGGIGEGVASVTLGKFSATMGQASGSSSLYDVDMRRAVRRELVGSTLLYQGLQLCPCRAGCCAPLRRSRFRRQERPTAASSRSL